MTQASDQTILAFFDKYAVPEPNSGCLIWTGPVRRGAHGQPYAIVWNGETHERANRSAYRIFCGPLIDERFVCHKCDTPLCVNPDHLFLGTPLENVSDMISKGRNADTRGDKNGRSILTSDDVRSIRQDSRSTNKIASRYGVSVSTISRVKSRRLWGSVL